MSIETISDLEVTRPPEKPLFTTQELLKIGLGATRAANYKPPTPSAPVTPFEHLFPLTSSAVSAETLHERTQSAQGAEQLADQLEDGNPYKDFAYSQLASHYLEEDNPSEAYRLLEKLQNDELATHTLSKILFYNDANKGVEIVTEDGEAVSVSQLRGKLREKIQQYEAMPDTMHALLLKEAAPLFSDSQKIQELAEKAADDHQEINPIDPNAPDLDAKLKLEPGNEATAGDQAKAS